MKLRVNPNKAKKQPREKKTTPERWVNIWTSRSELEERESG
jgi:hypothetical protein